MEEAQEKLKIKLMKFQDQNKNRLDDKIQLNVGLSNSSLVNPTTIMEKMRQSKISLESMPNLFVYDQITEFFKIDLVSQKGMGRSMTKKYESELRSLNMFLLNRIEIGKQVPQKFMNALLGIHCENLQEIFIQRYWHKNDTQKQLGLQFLKNTANFQKLSKVTLKGNYLPKASIESLQQSQVILPSLKVLKLDFQQQVDGKLIVSIFELFDEGNEEFRICLTTSKTYQELDFNARFYQRRIDLIPKKKNAPNLLEQRLESGEKKQTIQKQSFVSIQNKQNKVQAQTIEKVNFGFDGNINHINDNKVFKSTQNKYLIQNPESKSLRCENCNGSQDQKDKKIKQTELYEKLIQQGLNHEAALQIIEKLPDSAPEKDSSNRIIEQNSDGFQSDNYDSRNNNFHENDRFSQGSYD